MTEKNKKNSKTKDSSAAPKKKTVKKAVKKKPDTKQFQRKVETFRCEHCGVYVEGDGYTNHCPNCLWSKHVDMNPGDRAATCGASMEPVWVEYNKGSYMIVHKCTKCGHTMRVRARETDNFNEVLNLVKTSVEG